MKVVFLDRDGVVNRYPGDTRSTLDRFTRTFVAKKVYRDAFVGFMIVFFTSLYQIMSFAKYWEMKHEKNN